MTYSAPLELTPLTAICRKRRRKKGTRSKSNVGPTTQTPKAINQTTIHILMAMVEEDWFRLSNDVIAVRLDTHQGENQ